MYINNLYPSYNIDMQYILSLLSINPFNILKYNNLSMVLILGTYSIVNTIINIVN